MAEIEIYLLTWLRWFSSKISYEQHSGFAVHSIHCGFCDSQGVMLEGNPSKINWPAILDACAKLSRDNGEQFISATVS